MHSRADSHNVLWAQLVLITSCVFKSPSAAAAAVQNYYDSISVVGSCAFVQTGVIGECNRDGNRCATAEEKFSSCACLHVSGRIVLPACLFPDDLSCLPWAAAIARACLHTMLSAGTNQQIQQDH
jgi:hypothetical protein